MFGRERVVPSILAAVGAVLAGVLVGSGFAGRSGGAVDAVAVQAVMPRVAHAAVPDPADPSAGQRAAVGRRVAVALHGARAAGIARPAATGHSRAARARAGKRLGQVKAGPPAPRRAASRAQHRRPRHHLHAGRGHRHSARHHGVDRHHARGHRRRHHAHHVG